MRRSLAAALTLLALAGCGQAGTGPFGPGRPWRLAYDGYGHVSASTRHGVVYLTLKPSRAASPASTHAALVLSRKSMRDFTLEIWIRTNRQLRQPQPNPWEVGWLLWHYSDDEHFYYVALKPNGWELGKADPGYPGNQRFLATGTRPVFPPARWYAVGVRQRGAAIQVSVAGRPLVRYVDTQRPYHSGSIGLYAEDASATFQPVAFGPAP
jgi:3-keto-disaccharide hydrolase